MAGTKNDLAWLVAVVLAGTTALFAWQYANARNETAALRVDFDALKTEYTEILKRLEDLQGVNTALMRDMSGLGAQLNDAMSELELLNKVINEAAIAEHETGTPPDPTAPTETP